MRAYYAIPIIIGFALAVSILSVLLSQQIGELHNDIPVTINTQEIHSVIYNDCVGITFLNESGDIIGAYNHKDNISLNRQGIMEALRDCSE